MTANRTAMAMQLTSDDGLQHQQAVLFPDSKTTYRRTVGPDKRTKWRYGHLDNPVDWFVSFVRLAAEQTPTRMNVDFGCVLMEVTEDECSEAPGQSLPRNVGLRYQRMLDENDGTVTENAEAVREWMEAWYTAIGSEDNDWLADHTHPAGSAKATPAPTAAPAATAPPVDDNPHGWVYPSMSADGFIIRPNGQAYRTRPLAGMLDVQLLRKARLRGEHVFLWGDPGTGKTALVEAAFGTELVTMIGTEDTEKADFIGGYGPTGNPDNPYRWDDAALLEAMERGVPLFVDECGVVAPRTMTVVYSVADGRGVYKVTDNPARGTVVAKPGFMLILATNPHAPGVRISEALTSRVDHSIEVRTDHELMRKLGVPEELVTVAANMRTRRDSGDLSVWEPQARELLRAKTQVDEYGMDVAVGNLISACPEDSREVLAEAIKRTLGGGNRKHFIL